MNAFLTDSSILVPFQEPVRLDNAVKIKTVKEVVTVEKKFIPKFYKFTFWFFLVVVIMGFVIFVAKRLILFKLRN